VYDIEIPYGAENKLFYIYFYYLSEIMREKEREKRAGPTFEIVCDQHLIRD
jgi:hypothetical protein